MLCGEQSRTQSMLTMTATFSIPAPLFLRISRLVLKTRNVIVQGYEAATGFESMARNQVKEMLSMGV